MSSNICFYERVFRITDCDDFTKKFYEDMGVKLNEKEALPIDKFDIN